ncbi:MAG TPA: hypothetical protein VGM19_13715 [Armatimonadota bacterium]
MRAGLLALLAELVYYVLAAYGNHPFAYPLDDPYIHLTLARNLAHTGVLGINPGVWASASSSPLWTLLLTAVITFAPGQDTAPLVLNLILAAGLLWWLGGFLLDRGWSPFLALLLGLAFMLAVPLAPLAFTGMEHVLHLVLVVALLLSVARHLDHRSPVNTPLILAALATAARFESFFLLLGMGLFLVVGGRRRLGVALPAVGALVICTFGAINLAHGESFLPNTMLVKALAGAQNGGLLVTKAEAWVRQTTGVPALLALLALLSGMIWYRSDNYLERRSLAWQTVVGGFLVGATLHLALAAVGWFARYEAYLLGSGMVVWAWAYTELRRGHRGPARVRRTANSNMALLLAVSGLVILPPFLSRAGLLKQTAPAMAEVYFQQLQVAHFVEHYYRDQIVAANDIGAVSYYSHSRLVDLMGLANHPLARARYQGTLTTDRLDEVVKEQGARIAIAYPEWFRQGPPPPRWVLVATWKTPGEEIAVGGQVVGFYALEEDPAVLRSQLQEFQPQLPPEIEVTYLAPPAG